MGRTNRFVLTAGYSTVSTMIMSVLVVAKPASAYPTPVDFDGKLSRWNIRMGDAPITYEIKADDADSLFMYEDSVNEAAAMWSQVPTSYFKYERAAEDTVADVTINLQGSIAGETYSAGYAIFDQSDRHGPVHCSIFVGVSYNRAYVNLSKTLLHELGHCIGLGHSVIPQAIMSYKLSENSFALDVDDEAGVSRLYPADGSHPKLPPGCAIGSRILTAAQATQLFWFVLMLPACICLRANAKNSFSANSQHPINR